MEERKNQYGSARAHQSLLGGLLFCKNCGARYARQSYNGIFSYMCYSRSKKMKKMIKDSTCKNKNYRMEVLEGSILEEIRALAVEPDRIAQVRENRPMTDSTEKIKSITSESAKIDTQISKMMDLYALGSIDLDVISDKMATLNATKSGLKKELDSMRVPDDKDIMPDEQIRSVAALMADEDLTLEERRDIVQTLIRYIEIDEEKIIIHWKF